jgi:hypothetical protein
MYDKSKSIEKSSQYLAVSQRAVWDGDRALRLPSSLFLGVEIVFRSVGRQYSSQWGERFPML